MPREGLARASAAYGGGKPGGRLRPVSARIAVSSGLLRASMKASTAAGLVDAVVVFVAYMVTTWLPASGVWPALSSSGSVVFVPIGWSWDR